MPSVLRMCSKIPWSILSSDFETARDHINNVSTINHEHNAIKYIKQS